MKSFCAVHRMRAALWASVAVLAVLPGATASAQTQAQTAVPSPADGLQLTAAKVYTDAAGAYVSVAVKNTGAKTVSEVFVTCEFFAGKRSLGKSSTTVFSIVGGLTGTDQVRLLGGSSANRTNCAITGQK
ncbi:hypothetical protein ABLE93_12500 [Xanthobacter sp. KR7-65]|uniref:hypothetical protein n=1 Tax=Xanthobacter sp. KR7-65 TaxID=3156612 RepID=UPI0032B567F8